MEGTRNSKRMPNLENLGKKCRDLFNNNYCIDSYTLNVSAVTPKGVRFSVYGLNKNNRISGNLITNYQIGSTNDLNATYKIKWSTSNQMDADLIIKNVYGKHADCYLGVVLAPHMGIYGASIGAVYSVDNFRSDTKLHITTADKELGFKPNTIIVKSFVFGYKCCITGVGMRYDKLKNDADLYLIAEKQYKNVLFHADLSKTMKTLQTLREFTLKGSMYSTIDKVDCGVNVELINGEIDTFNVGFGYRFSKNCEIKAKTEFCSRLSFSVVNRLSPGILFTVSYRFDGYAPYKKHLLGLGLDLEI